MFSLFKFSYMSDWCVFTLGMFQFWVTESIGLFWREQNVNEPKTKIEIRDNSWQSHKRMADIVAV